MAFGLGYWLNPRTMKHFPVSTHEQWIYDADNAKAIGLADMYYEELRRHPASDADAIRTIACRGGLVRIRDHGNKTAVQFFCERYKVRNMLWAIQIFFDDIKANKFTELFIHNLADNDSTTISLDDMRQRLQNDEPVLREEISKVPDIPYNAELNTRLNQLFKERE